MVRPRPGLCWGTARRLVLSLFGRVEFAHSICRGLALFEEAFDHGCERPRPWRRRSVER